MIWKNDDIFELFYCLFEILKVKIVKIRDKKNSLNEQPKKSSNGQKNLFKWATKIFQMS